MPKINDIDESAVQSILTAILSSVPLSSSLDFRDFLGLSTESEKI